MKIIKSQADMGKKPRLLLKLFMVVGVLSCGLCIYLDAWIFSRFSGSKWQLPVKVYARPLEIYNDKHLSVEQLEYELDALAYRMVDRVTEPGQVSFSSGQYQIYRRTFRFSDGWVTAQEFSFSLEKNRVTQLQLSSVGDKNSIFLEPQSIGNVRSGHYEDRDLITLDQVPPTLIEALIVVEDRGFINHFGFSFRGIARAAVSNLRSGSVVQGGSTLTQQLIKNFFLSSQRSLWRKLLELPMAVLLELRFDKEEILEAYINEVFLGQKGQRAIHGFNLASQYYFGLDLIDTNLSQQALLVAMVRGASYYNPALYPERAKKRRDLVLDIMQQQQLISRETMNIAQSHDLTLSSKPKLRKENFPAFMSFIRRQLKHSASQDMGNKHENLARIFTTLDPYVQYQAEQSLTQTLNDLEQKYRLKNDSLQGALVSVHPQSGDILAIVGGRYAQYAGFNRALDALRPIGSLIKPAVYLSALDSGDYHLATLLSDAAVSVSGQDGSMWQPQNFDHLDHGKVLLNDALKYSYNQATARLGMMLGIDTVINNLQKLGVQRSLPAVPSLFLGAASLSVLEVASMYNTIANRGRLTQLRGMTALESTAGEVFRFQGYSQQRFEQAPMYLLRHALRDVVVAGTARSAQQVLQSGFSVAGKTGTTNDLRDSWFAGFSEDLLAVVWVGRDDNGKTPLTGSSGALRIWSNFMSKASYESLDMKPPQGIKEFWVDSGGRLSAKGCEGAVALPFIIGSEPTEKAECSGRLDTIWNWFKRVFRGG